MDFSWIVVAPLSKTFFGSAGFIGVSVYSESCVEYAQQPLHTNDDD